MSTDRLTALAETIVGHPGFPKAARRYLVEYLAWRDRLGVLNKVVANAARLRILENLIYLHYTRPAGGSVPGATFERLTELSGYTDDIGARAVRTLLRLAQIGGLVAARRDDADARLRVYQPTDALIEIARDYTKVTLRPLDVVFPHLQIVERLDADLDYYGIVASKFARIFLERRPERFRTLGPFRQLMRLEGASPILAVVIDSHFNGRDVPPAPQLSRRFYLSQSQIRALLKAAEHQGLVRIGPRGRLIDAEPLSRALFGAYALFLAFAAKNAFGVETSDVG